MKESLTTIVIPVYNVKDFLMRCLESLMEIDYDDKEIIVVDDCSTDGSGELCDSFAVTHPGVVVLHHQENKGVTEARMTGIRNAGGEYVMFVDADDYVHPQILRIMTNAASEHKADMVCTSFYCVDGDNLVKDNRPITGVIDRQEINEIVSNNILYDRTTGNAGMSLFLWAKLIKKSLLEGSLQKGAGLIYGEDSVAVLDMVVNKCEKIVCIDDPLYYYVQHPSQVTGRSKAELCQSFISVWERFDAMGIQSWYEQLSQRMFRVLKPSLYDKPDDSFIKTYRTFRNSEVVKKYLWDNRKLSPEIKRHPHWFLLKYRLYLLDYILYAFAWALKKGNK